MLFNHIFRQVLGMRVHIRLKIRFLDLDSVLESVGHAEKPISLSETLVKNNISGIHRYNCKTE